MRGAWCAFAPDEGAVLHVPEDGVSIVRRGEHFIAFDGVIHDAPERAGAGDAALVLSLLLRHGEQALHTLNGVFAFVAWDADRRRLLAVRDRFGTKTLYWRRARGRIVIGPRIAPLLDPGARRLDRAAALDFLVNGFTDQDDHTLFAVVRQLPPRSILTIDGRDGTAVVRPWYELPEPDEAPMSEADAVEAFRSIFADAVALRCQDARSGGLMLSGGIDSSALAALIPRERATPLRTYKACFGSAIHDQPAHVGAVVDRVAAEHHQFQVRGADTFRLRETIIDALELPYERSIVCGHWALSSLMAQHGVQWTMDGVGADEQLGGYRVFQTSFAALERGERPHGLAFVGASRPAASFETTCDLRALYSWLAPAAREEAIATMRAERAIRIDSFGAMCRHHMHRGALPMLLRINRELAAAFGQQSISPFLDHRLVELSISLGSAHKIVRGRSKYVLRRAVEDVVPPDVVWYDDKRSYLDVEVAWLRAELARLRGQVRETEDRWPELFARSELPCEAATADKLEILRLWRIACFGVWARRFNVVP
jgi:asparagine synthase (glutamine-hydrolysing)